MRDLLHDSSTQILILAIAYIAAGFGLCFFNTDILLSAIQIAGVLALLFSFYLLYLWFYKKAANGLYQLVSAIPLLLFSLVMCFSPQSLLTIIPILVALLIVLSSAVEMRKAFTIKKYGSPSWKILLIVSLVMLCGGLVLLLRPIQTLSWILKLVGLCLAGEGLWILYSLYFLGMHSSRHAKP